MYSDRLFQPWLCATQPMTAEWMRLDNIPREGNLSLADFKLKYERPNRPVRGGDTPGAAVAVVVSVVMS